MRALLALVLVWFAAALPAVACGVCITSPERTVSDRLIGDDVLVLARPAEGDPFRFSPVRTLRGSVSTAPPPDLLVPSALRARFRADPDLTVVMSYGPVEPGTQVPARPGLRLRATPTGKVWKLLLEAEPQRLRHVEEIVAKAPAWGMPGPRQGPAPRFDYFAALHASDDPTLQRIAIRELRKWPYARLRSLQPEIPLAEIRAAVNDLYGIPDAPLYIQLIGLSADPAADAIVAESASRALARAGSTGLPERTGAWALALMERRGLEGLGLVEARLLAAPGIGPETRRLGLEAVAEIASVREDLRPEAARALAALASREPEFLADVSAVLRRWGDWRLAAEAEARLALAGLPPAEAFALRHYLAAARAGH